MPIPRHWIQRNDDILLYTPQGDPAQDDEADEAYDAGSGVREAWDALPCVVECPDCLPAPELRRRSLEYATAWELHESPGRADDVVP